jgi:hypothetical protein
MPFPAGAVDREMATERRDAVGEPAQTSSARCVGAADAVVADLDAQHLMFVG